MTLFRGSRIIQIETFHTQYRFFVYVIRKISVSAKMVPVSSRKRVIGLQQVHTGKTPVVSVLFISR